MLTIPLPSPWARTATLGRTRSLLATVKTALFAPRLAGVNSIGKSWQALAAIETGKEPVALNWLFEEEMPETSRFTNPVLHTWSVVLAVSPAHVSAKLAFVGAWISGTQQTVSRLKNVSMLPVGVIPAGGVAEAQAV